MRILINDFGGYPFTVELSRYLSQNGYTIKHCYVSNIKTPHGNMSKTETDPDSLSFEPVILDGEFKKYSPWGRYKGETQYSRKLTVIIDDFKPEIVFSANTPLIAQGALLKSCKKRNIKFVYWCQDIHSIALEKFFKKKLPLVGRIFTAYFKRLELKLLKQSNHVITISNSFNQIFMNWGIPSNQMSTIHNWGTLNEIELLPKVNNWSVTNEVSSKRVVLYTGTLGLKHDPLVIVDAAKHFLHIKDVVFIVISEGIGAKILLEQKELFKLNNLLVFPFQEYNILSQVLSSADVLLSILEKDAALFSVPSKVLTYLCAQRAILLSVPEENLSAKIVMDNNAGFCVEPGNTKLFLDKLSELLNDPLLRDKMGKNGRAYAEENFNIAAVSARFMHIIDLLAK